MRFVKAMLSTLWVVVLLRFKGEVEGKAQRYTLSLSPGANGGTYQCSPGNITRVEYNVTVTAPGALGVFLANQPAVQYLLSLTDLQVLADPNNTNALPFPPMSCWNPNNTVSAGGVRNETLYQDCKAKMPDGFKIQPPQVLCVVLKNSANSPSTSLNVQLDADWDPVSLNSSSSGGGGTTSSGGVSTTNSAAFSSLGGKLGFWTSITSMMLLLS